MAIEDLRDNIEHIRELIKQAEVLVENFGKLAAPSPKDNENLETGLEALANQLKMVNDAVPSMLGQIKIEERKEAGAREEAKEKELAKVSYATPIISPKERIYITLKRKDKARFLEELRISGSAIKKLRKKYEEEEVAEFKKANIFAKLSNKFFFKWASQLSQRKTFKDLNLELRKANFPFLLTTYISMMMMTMVLVFAAACLLVVMFMFFEFSPDLPFLVATKEGIALRLLKTAWIIIGLPALTALAFYFYPSLERQSLGGKIDQELPFVAIHMSAIAGSGIEPTNIFKIVASGTEYKNTREELKKVINLVNLYGYDTVTALRNTAKSSPSSKLSDLLNGLATTITTGGSLTSFLEKRAETLLFDYKLERDKQTRSAETFMDLYISVVIAAPMILMLMLILMSVSGIGLGMGVAALTVIIVSIVAIINVLFLVFLHIRQPKS